MNTVQIRLKSQRALVGIGREPARYNMRWQPPQLKMKRTPVSVQLKSHGPSLKLDQQAVWEEIGTGGIYHVIDEALAHSRQQVIEAIGRIALRAILAAIERQNTSKLALTGQGSGTERQERFVPFPNGKVYHADLNATYNIGARYLREYRKPFEEWLCEAKVLRWH